MALDIKHTVDQSSIDAILKGLANRPNVASILILSRRDGSIIRATGFPDFDGANDITGRKYTSSQLNDTQEDIRQITQETQDAKSDENVQGERLSPAQRLAESIQEFVSVSSRLAADISQSRSNPANTNIETLNGSGSLSKEQGGEQPVVSEENDVQLLRMRTKRQEVIIFPDANYLGCVIQNLSKTTGRYEPA